MDKNVTKTIMTLVLILTIIASLVYLPSINATITNQLFPFLSVNPNPVGVGQTVTILVFTQPIPPTGNDRFYNLTVTLTKPDGATQTFGPSTSGSLGNAIWYFTPTDVGTYKFKFVIPNQTYPDRDLVYLGAESPIVELNVTSISVEPLPDAPLPTEYWTYPINAQNHAWASISGSWLMINYESTKGGPANGDPNYYTTGPKTSHILWKWRNAFGGIEGGKLEAVAYYEGHEYELKWRPGIVINNYFYQYGPIGDRYLSGITPLNAFDIQTGKIVWSKNISVSWGQVYRVVAANQVGLHAYLWGSSGTTWKMYDAFTGEWLMDWVNVTTGGVTVFEPYTGNMLNYLINTQEGWMAMWNFTKACDQGVGIRDSVFTYQSQAQRDQFGIGGGSWSPRSTAANDWSKGIEWNVTIPVETQAGGRLTFSSGKIAEGVAIAQSSFSDPLLAPQSISQVCGYSLGNENPRKIWGPVNLTAAITTAFAIGSNTFVLFDPNNRRYVGYDLQTGIKKWDTDQMTYPWGSYSDLHPLIYEDKLYASAYDGLHSWDINTGKELWHFTTGNAGIETPYGTWVGRNTGGMTIGDGKVYWFTGVWHPSPVMQRGDKLYCVDAKEGKNLWNITFFGDLSLLAQGHYIAANGYDNIIYCFNKGPSSTTVTIQQDVIEAGASILIKGTVTDQSPAAKELVEQGRFSMVPAIADIHMDGWMDYLYMQQPKPDDMIGVPVLLQAIRSDGTPINIGEVYSDEYGQFAKLWTPLAQDTYRIVATFRGSDGYWSSSAATALGVIAPHTPALLIESIESAEQTEASEPAETPSATEIAIIVVFVIASVIGTVSYWALKKRK